MILLQTYRTVLLGLRNVRLHKLRSFLTVLGIVFGVCSVISMLSIGEGASREVLDQIRQLGSQNIIIQSVKPPRDASGSTSSRGRRGGGPPTALDYGLRYADAERLMDTLPTVKIIVPIKSIDTTVRYRDQSSQAKILGTVPWYPESASIVIAEGRFLTRIDLDEKQNVCVIGRALARTLFVYRNPIGESMRIGRNTYRVIGIIDDKKSGGGENSADLPSQTGDVYVPITTLRAFEGDLFFQVGTGSSQSEYVELHELIVQTKNTEDVMATADMIQKILDDTHKTADFKLIVPLRLLEQARRTQAIFSAVLGSIAAISLLVGGIGIMNIMLASVSERTREIGIRRALGARQNDIMLQFLVECLILSLGGGLIGMGMGAGIPWLVTHFAKMPTVLTAGAFILSFVVSAAVGLIFGLYPARRAALMDPIDALRHE